MNSKSVCRLCLAIDTPVRVIADTPLQEVYEKLTNVSLNSPYKPVEACNLCYWQLRKCYKLRTMSLRANELLIEVLQTGEWIKQDLSSIINRETCKLDDGLTISTMELNVFGSEYGIEEKIKDEPKDIDIETERMTYVDNIKAESSQDDASGPENVINIKTEQVIHEEYAVYEKGEDVEDITNGIEETEELILKNIYDADPGKTCDLKPIITGIQHTPVELSHDYSTTRATDEYEEKNSNKNTIDEDLPKKYICDACGDIFSRKYLLIRHIVCYNTVKNKQSPKTEKLYKCNICKKIYQLRPYFERHMKTHVSDDTLKCRICRKMFDHRGHFNQHLRTHNKDKPFECVQCGKKFNRRNDLNVHLRTHSGDKPFECALCPKKFNQRGHLNQHIRTHSKEKPFKCSICWKRFSRQTHVNSHLKTHSGNIFECTICQNKFSKRSHLNKHLLIHSAEKHLKCALCDKNFYRQSDLSAHLRTHPG